MSTIINIPEEAFSLLNIHNKENDIPISAIVNTNLLDFEYKEYFQWECVVYIAYSPCESGLPDHEEYDRLNSFFDELDTLLKHDKEHPNALFFVRILSEGEAECVWMLNNPNIASESLDNLIDSGDYDMEFEYRIEQDSNWENYSYFLDRKNVIKSDASANLLDK